mmetsp:Transcript_4960/g.8509  ORF Transcript_4960/g.8509 Transcript_4960/m.8509 type:complete len:110 (+) Transcript_4960:2435-2764(+)
MSQKRLTFQVLRRCLWSGCPRSFIPNPILRYCVSLSHFCRFVSTVFVPHLSRQPFEFWNGFPYKSPLFGFFPLPLGWFSYTAFVLEWQGEGEVHANSLCSMFYTMFLLK